MWRRGPSRSRLQQSAVSQVPPAAAALCDSAASTRTDEDSELDELRKLFLMPAISGPTKVADLTILSSNVKLIEDTTSLPTGLSIDGTWELLVTGGPQVGQTVRYAFHHQAGSRDFTGQQMGHSSIQEASIDFTKCLITWKVMDSAADGVCCQAQLELHSQPPSLNLGTYWHIPSGVVHGSFRGRRLGLPPEQARQETAAAETASSAYTEPASIVKAVRDGDVLLVKASWLLRRAGFEEKAQEPVDGDDFIKWECVTGPEPLPNRQQIEAMPEAERLNVIMTAEEIEAGHRAFRHIADEATKDWDDWDHDLDALPVVAVSQCWEEPSHPDGACRTLLQVANALAGEWRGEDPISGLELFRDWGFKDIGVFFDWCSLYQNKPVTRTTKQEEVFQRALSNMSLWYAHKLTTVYLIWGQDDFLRRYQLTDGQLIRTQAPLPRSRRGWPFYEESMSLLLKDPPDETRQLIGYFVPARHTQANPSRRFHGELWTNTRFVEALSRENMRHNRGEPELERAKRAWDAAGYNEASRFFWPKLIRIGESLQVAASTHYDINDITTWPIRPQLGGVADSPPPLSPTSFEAMLKAEKEFTNHADHEVVSRLYRRTMLDGFGGVRVLEFNRITSGLNEGRRSPWNDEHVRMLCETLQEARCPLAEKLVVKTESLMNLTPLGKAIRHGALPNLRTLNLSGCCQLRSIPEELGWLGYLEELLLYGCKSLVALPKSITQLTSLRLLDLTNATGFAYLPDLSAQTQLRVKHNGGPDTPWEKGGRKAWSVIADGWPRDSTRVDIRSAALTQVPAWIMECKSLEFLVLDCKGLDSMPDLSNLSQTKVKLSLTVHVHLSEKSRALLDDLGDPNEDGLSQDERNQRIANIDEMQPTLPGEPQIWVSLERKKLRVVLPYTYHRSGMSCPEKRGYSRLQPWEDGGRNAWDLIADGWPRDSREISFCGFQGADLPPWLAECKGVCVLDLYACSNIKSLPQFLGDLVNVHFMDISECSSLTHLPAALSRMVSLTLLRMNGCTSINFLPDLSNLRHRGLKIALDDRLFPWLDAGCAECSGFASV